MSIFFIFLWFKAGNCIRKMLTNNSIGRGSYAKSKSGRKSLAHPDLSSVTITVDQVNNILQKLDVNKLCCLDGISPIFLKCFSHYLSPSSCSLFNRSLRDDVQPNDWLKANVCPVYIGEGDKNYINNYRRISRLSVVSKVAERCIYNSVISVMD